MSKKGTYPENWSYDITYLDGGCMTSYILYYAILQKPTLLPTTIPAYSLTYGGAQALIGNRPRQQEGPYKGTGRRIIGQASRT